MNLRKKTFVQNTLGYLHVLPSPALGLTLQMLIFLCSAASGDSWGSLDILDTVYLHLIFYDLINYRQKYPRMKLVTSALTFNELCLVS